VVIHAQPQRTSNVRFGIDLQSQTCQQPGFCHGRARRVRPPFFGDSINEKSWEPVQDRRVHVLFVGVCCLARLTV
jgi:hypothetical protein